MALLPYSLPQPGLAERREVRRWPATIPRRYLLRFALCLPFVALAAWAEARGVRSGMDAALERAARSLVPGSSGFAFVAHAYPPVPLVLARLIPGAPGTLAIVGALGAGVLLHSCWEHLVRAQAPAWLVAVLLVGLAGAPALWFNAIENLAGFLGLACFAVAMVGVFDFVFSGRTSGGYAAGASLALAVLCDPAAVLYVASLFVAAPFLGWERLRREPYSVRSTLAVLSFPTVALVGVWAFLEWRFTGAAWHPIALAPGAFHFPRGVVAELSAAISRTGWQLVCCPVFVVSALVVLWRRSIAFVGFLAVPLGLVMSAWLGLHSPASQGIVLLDLLGLLLIPSRPKGLAAALYAASVPAGIALSLVVFGSDGMTAFLHGIGL